MSDGVPATEQSAREALVAAAQRMISAGLNQGGTGSLSMRWHRGHEDGMLVTPTARDDRRLAADDLAWVPLVPDTPDPDASQPTPRQTPARWFGDRPPSTEWRMHRDVYLGRTDAGSIVHAHAPFATTIACTTRGQRDGIPPFHDRVAIVGGGDIRCAIHAPFGSPELSTAVLAALVERRACLLANHGLLALGATLDDALALAIEVESLARIYWQASVFDQPVLLDAATIERAQSRLGGYRGR